MRLPKLAGETSRDHFMEFNHLVFSFAVEVLVAKSTLRQVPKAITRNDLEIVKIVLRQSLPNQ